MRRSIARSLGLPPSLATHMDVIFAGLDDLGSSPALIASMVGRLPRPQRILDLACGKGGVGVALARRCDCPVVGVDACASFIRSAKALAQEHGVGRACTFRVGDVRAFRASRPFDLALMLGLFGVERAPRLLRRQVTPAGFYIFDDAVRTGRSRGLQGVPTLEAVRRVIRELGDTIVDEQPLRDTRRQSLAITRRCKQLAKQRPELARSLATFVEHLEASQKLLRTRLQAMVWCVKKQ